MIPLAALYLGFFLANWNSHLSFSSLDSVYAIFQSPAMVLAAWIHFLIFDLFVGSWMVRDGQRLAIPHVLLIPCLVLTFLMGPAGLVLYLLLRLGLKKALAAS